MIRIIALSATLGLALATAAGTSAFAQSGTPGSAPPKPNRVAATPTPPPPGGPDKLTTRAQPPAAPGTGPQGTHINFWPPPSPKLVDDLAAPKKQRRPGVGDLASAPKRKKGPLFDDCNSSDCNIESYTTDCKAAHGGLSSNADGSISCNAGPQHEPN